MLLVDQKLEQLIELTFTPFIIVFCEMIHGGNETIRRVSTLDVRLGDFGDALRECDYDEVVQSS
jgi:hypothetical protein